MNLSQSQQYYLQSMGIDLYVAGKTEPSVPSPKPSQSEPVAQGMSLTQFKATPWLADICLALNIGVDEIEVSKQGEFKLARLRWLFEPQQTEPVFKGGLLSTSTIEALSSSKAKQALWQCLSQYLDDSLSD